MSTENYSMCLITSFARCASLPFSAIHRKTKAAFMSATLIENILDFVCDLNAPVGVHQYPVNQQLGQVGD